MKNIVVFLMLCLYCGMASAQSRDYKIGDVVDGGVLWYISEDGMTGKVLYPGRSKNKVVFSTRVHIDVTVSSSPDDGQANVAILKQLDPALESLPAAKYCEDLEGDWYLPARNEAMALFEVYNGTTYDDATVQKPEYITIEEKNARARFDRYLGKARGVKLNTMSPTTNGVELWTSSWTGPGTASVMRFGLRKLYSDSFDGTNRHSATGNYARCIKKVDLNK